MNSPYTEGPLDAKICFIGEAPGVQEVSHQRPFVGPAGHLFDNLLSRSGIVRAECRIENVVQERPPNNDIWHFIDLRKAEPIITEEGQKYLSSFYQRIDNCKANVLVPLGNVPLWALTGLKAITKRRGSILSADFLLRNDHTPDTKGRKVIPTIHPSAALRQYLYRHYIAHDLKRALRESETPDINLMQRTLILDPTFNDIINYIKYCHDYPSVGFDIEVTREEVSHISLAPMADHAMCIPLFEGRENFNPHQEAAIWLELAKLLQNPKVKKISHNMAFDASFVYQKYGIRTRPIDDTMIAFAVAFPDFPKGLDFVTSIYCNGEPYYKDEGKTWFKNPFKDFMQFRRYSAMDAAVLPEILPKVEKDLRRLGNYETYQRQLKIVEPLVFMSTVGIKMDRAGLVKAASDTRDKIHKLTIELNEITAPIVLNIKSPKQVANYLYVNRGIKPITHKGRPTTDGKAMNKLAARGIREAEIIVALRHEHKMKGTYYEVELDDDGRLRCSYNPVGTKQGRTSSSKTIFGRGANMQNQPEPMKRMMQADPGMFFTNIDASQAENRVVAYVANEEAMIQAFENGIDIHNQTAALIYSKDIEDVLKDERKMGKKANHSLDYDEGPGEFSLIHQIPFTEAKFIVNRFHTVYPGIREWHASIRYQLSHNMQLKNCFGRVYKFMDRIGQDLYKQAYSFIPQSTVADMVNVRGTQFTHYNTDNITSLIRAQLVNTVHDSILFQYMLDKLPEWYHAVSKIVKSMEQPLFWEDRMFVIPADISVGLNGYDMLEITSKEFHSSSCEEVLSKVYAYLEECLDAQATA